MPDTDANTKKEFDEAYEQAFRYWQPYFVEAKNDIKFSLGDQWTSQDKAYLEQQRRNALVFDKVRRVLRSISGYQRKNRLALKVDPVEGSDELTAAQLSAVILWVMQYQNGYHTMSNAFTQGPLKTGINLVNFYLDYSDDPVHGDICFRRTPYNKFLLDPNFSELDFTDLQYLLRREYLSRDSAKSLLPKRASEIEKLHPRGRDLKYPYFYPSKDIQKENLMAYDEFWVREFKKVTVLLDPATGAQKEWTADEKRLRLFLKEFPHIKTIDRYRKTVKLRILVEGEVMYNGPGPAGIDDYQYIALMGFWDPEYDQAKWKLQGAVRCMRDPQTESNKRRSKMLDIIDSQISSGWKAEENSVVNPKAMYQSGQGAVVWTKQGSFEKVEKLTAADIPTGMFNLTDLFDKDLIETAGANQELFGMAESEDVEIAAILAKIRQGAALTVMQDLFDNHRLSKKLLGMKLIKVIQKNWGPEKIQRIINQQPSPEFYTRHFGKYDAVPVEGLLTDTQRQMYYAQLNGLKRMGAPIPWAAIIDAMPLQDKRRLQEIIAQEEKKQAQMGQAQAQELMLKNRAMIAKIMSDTANAEEQRAQAVENRSNAALDRIRTIRELAKLDDDRLLQYLDFVLRLENHGGQQGQGAGSAPGKVLNFTRR